MSKHTHIAWCDSTFNHMIGCAKVSPGCKNCYAEQSTPARAMNIEWGYNVPRRRTSVSNWKEVLRWNKEGPRKVFCASLADWLDDADVLLNDGSIDTRGMRTLVDLLQLIHATPNLTWLLLSKRLGNITRAFFESHDNVAECSCDFERWIMQWRDGFPPANVWLGASVEDQQRANERIPELLNIPAKVRFLSCEPLLESIDLPGMKYDGGMELLLKPVDWVIVGGESGHKARPCNIEWIRDVVQQCKNANVPCFVKQLGSIPGTSLPPEFKAGNLTQAMHLNHPKGGDPSEWPEDLRVQQFPEETQ